MKAGWKRRATRKTCGISNTGVDDLHLGLQTHTHTNTRARSSVSTLLKGPLVMWWLDDVRGETLFSGEVLRKH